MLKPGKVLIHCDRNWMWTKIAYCKLHDYILVLGEKILACNCRLSRDQKGKFGRKVLNKMRAKEQKSEM